MGSEVKCLYGPTQEPQAAVVDGYNTSLPQEEALGTPDQREQGAGDTLDGRTDQT